MDDLAKDLKQLGSQGTEYKYDEPSVAILETFESPMRQRFEEGMDTLEGEVRIEFPEFTSLCPKTGQPDFANIVIKYIPRRLCVESKSLKLYFFAYRNTGAFMEQITQKICDDLVNLLDPLALKVEGQFAPRGATRLWPSALYQAKDFGDS